MKRRRLARFAALFVGITIAVSGIFPGLAPAPKAEASSATLTVNAGTVVAPMKKEMRGTNVGLWTNSSYHPVSTRS